MILIMTKENMWLIMMMENTTTVMKSTTTMMKSTPMVMESTTTVMGNLMMNILTMVWARSMVMLQDNLESNCKSLRQASKVNAAIAAWKYRTHTEVVLLELYFNFLLTCVTSQTKIAEYCNR
jgi:branched-subunit amino acid transport protein